MSKFFFFQAEDGIRDKLVTGVQTCALPISLSQSICCLPLPVQDKPHLQLACRACMTYTMCHTDRLLQENTDAFYPLETRARTPPLAPRAANRPHQDLLRHQAHRGKHRRPGRPLPRRSPPQKSRQALLQRPGPEAAWLGRLSTTRAPLRTSRNSILRYSAKFSTSWKSASAGRRTRAPLASRAFVAPPFRAASLILSDRRVQLHFACG